MRIGPGIADGVEMGPLVDSRALKGVSHYAEIGRSEGARFLTGGTPPTTPEHQNGHFFKPTVIEARPEMEIAKEEVFVPVLSVIPAADLHDALQIANSVR